MISKPVKILILVAVVIVVIFLGWYFIKKSAKISAPALTTPPASSEEEVSPTVTPEEKSKIEENFENAPNIKPQSPKAQAVDAILRPVLSSVFDKTDEKGQIVPGVKLTEESRSTLVYYFNRQLTEAERDGIILGLETRGLSVVDKTEKVYTIKNGNEKWTITFYLNDEEKSGLKVAF
jgi:hypothetical protein